MQHDPDRDTAIAEATDAARRDADLEGVAVTFERILVAEDAAVAAFAVDDRRRRIFVSLERARAGWDVLGSTILGPDTGGWQSFRPSETTPDRLTVVVAGIAPDGTRTAVIPLEADEHVVPILDRVYLFAASLEHQPHLDPEYPRLRVRFLA